MSCRHVPIGWFVTVSDRVINAAIVDLDPSMLVAQGSGRDAAVDKHKAICLRLIEHDLQRQLIAATVSFPNSGE